MRWRLSNSVFELVGTCLAWIGACTGGHESVEARCALLWSALWAIQCVPYYRSVGDRLNADIAVMRAVGLIVWVLF